MRQCNKCKQNKAAEDFYKVGRKCKECRKEYSKAYYEQNREKIKERKKAHYQQNAEKKKEQMKAYREQNREKINERQKAWYQQNSEKKKAYYEQNREKYKAYYKQNADKIKEYGKAWEKQNRDKRRIYERNKRKTDLNYKLSDNLRRRVRKVLDGKCKSKKTMDLIGCSADFLKKYLENQFQPGMSWNNYGNPNGDHSECWHMDHIVPCASFDDLDDPKQQQKCFHYSNLQPLWAKDNMSKGAKIN
jgi:hypothetical protein